MLTLFGRGSGLRRWLAGAPKSLIAVVAVLAMALPMAGLMAARPDAYAPGGAGGAPGGTVVGGQFLIRSYWYDRYIDGASPQGWGNASTTWFLNDTGNLGTARESGIRTACGEALAQANARAVADGVSNPQSRVVGIMWGTAAVDPDGPYSYGEATQSFYTNELNAWRDAGYPGVSSNTAANLSTLRSMIYGLASGEITSFGSTPIRAICVALNNTEPAAPVLDYDLGVQTDRQNAFSIAGGTTAVRDRITTTRGDSDIAENLNASVVLHWDGLPGSPAKSDTKSVVIPNNGTAYSPSFVPADFGWTTWPAGRFWFDVIVPKQGKMAAAVNTIDRDPRETWTAQPVPPNKNLYIPGTNTLLDADDVLASGQAYEARVQGNSNGYASMRMVDEIQTDLVYVGSSTGDVSSAVRVRGPNGAYVPATVTIDRSGGKVVVTATVSGITNHGAYTMIVPTFMRPTGEGYDIPDSSRIEYVGGPSVPGDDRETRKVSPTPDKVWVLDEAGALVASDPNHTNDVAADNKVFLPGSEVAAVVNGHVPANLPQALSSYVITDDWTDAEPYVDFSDASKVKIFAGGNDVTGQFTIEVNGSITTATANSDFLSGTRNRSSDLPIKLVLVGNFRDDYTTGGELVKLDNAGSEQWNNEEVDTNIPSVFTWTPDPHKDVIASAEQGGDQSSINTMSVFGGQKIEYMVNLDLRIPDGLAREIASFAVEDVYDPNFTPNKPSLEFFDARTNKIIPRSAFSTEWDDENHRFMVTFSDEWVSANLDGNTAAGWLYMRFDGVVNADVPDGTIVKNQAFEILNESKTPTEIPEVKVPVIEPDKEDLNVNLDNIDGKTVVEGDRIIYRLTMDGGPARSELAYNVHKLGMVDDYDEEYLELNADAIKVIRKDTGEDVTDKFNIQVSDGKAAIFARHVDSTNVNGEDIAGDPQPEDLFAYDSADIDPVNDPIIDQSLLGVDYWIMLDTKVIKETDGYVIENQAVQNIENVHRATRIVSNPLKDIDPEKDVVASEAEQDSLNGKEIALNSIFNYKLMTSEIPADRAYDATQWSITDTFDSKYDRYTGTWAVYTETDIYDGDTLVFSAGDLLADSAGHESETYSGMFTASFDEATYTFKVEATSVYFNLVNTRGDLVQKWSAYTQMGRIAPADKVVNVHTESYNKFDRPSNEVVTNTPENPAIDVEKYTLDEGMDKGDRDYADQAYSLSDEQVADGVKIGFKVTNTGDVALKDVVLSDATTDGEGVVSDIMCSVEGEKVAGDKIGVMEPGDEVMCEGMLSDMKHGASHADLAKAVGKSVFTDAEVSDEDPWHAKAPEDPSIDVEKYTLDEGVDKGDRDKLSEAFEVAAGKDVKVGFKVTNTGDVALKDVVLSDETTDGKGKVSDISCVVDDKLVAGDKIGVMEPGDEVLCVGTLKGLAAGEFHSDNSKAVGKSIFTDTEVSDEDMWHAKTPEANPPHPSVIKGGFGAQSTNTAVLVGGLIALLAGAGAVVVLALRRRRS